eukprot:scaffold2698_cov314-Chaetoceros_neogracile.AAC.3
MRCCEEAFAPQRTPRNRMEQGPLGLPPSKRVPCHSTRFALQTDTGRPHLFSTYGGGVVPHDFPPPVSFRYSRKEQCLGLHACDKISYETNDEPFPALQTDHGCTSNATYPRNDLILFEN